MRLPQPGRFLPVKLPPRALLAPLAGIGLGLLLIQASWFACNTGVMGMSDSVVRKTAHVVVYGSLALLLAKGLGNQFLLAWLIAGLLGAADEIHQLFVPFRAGRLSDWCLDMAGITIFLTAGKFYLPLALAAWRARRDAPRPADPSGPVAD